MVITGSTHNFVIKASGNAEEIMSRQKFMYITLDTAQCFPLLRIKPKNDKLHVTKNNFFLLHPAPL